MINSNVLPILNSDPADMIKNNIGAVVVANSVMVPGNKTNTKSDIIYKKYNDKIISIMSKSLSSLDTINKSILNVLNSFEFEKIFNNIKTISDNFILTLASKISKDAGFAKLDNYVYKIIDSVSKKFDMQDMIRVLRISVEDIFEDLQNTPGDSKKPLDFKLMVDRFSNQTSKLLKSINDNYIDLRETLTELISKMIDKTIKSNIIVDTGINIADFFGLSKSFHNTINRAFKDYTRVFISMINALIFSVEEFKEVFMRTGETEEEKRERIRKQSEHNVPKDTPNKQIEITQLTEKLQLEKFGGWGKIASGLFQVVESMSNWVIGLLSLRLILPKLDKFPKVKKVTDALKELPVIGKLFKFLGGLGTFISKFIGKVLGPIFAIGSFLTGFSKSYFLDKDTFLRSSIIGLQTMYDTMIGSLISGTSFAINSMSAYVEEQTKGTSYEIIGKLTKKMLNTVSNEVDIITNLVNEEFEFLKHPILKMKEYINKDIVLFDEFMKAFSNWWEVTVNKLQNKTDNFFNRWTNNLIEEFNKNSTVKMKNPFGMKPPEEPIKKSKPIETTQNNDVQFIPAKPEKKPIETSHETINRRKKSDDWFGNFEHWTNSEWNKDREITDKKFSELLNSSKIETVPKKESKIDTTFRDLYKFNLETKKPIVKPSETTINTTNQNNITQPSLPVQTITKNHHISSFNQLMATVY